MNRLAEFHIIGLYGRYSYPINFNVNERITAIVGPNGRGKTVCLKMIDAFFNRQHAYFFTIPFETARLVFTDGRKIDILWNIEREKNDEDGEQIKKLTYKLHSNKRKATIWEANTIDIQDARQITRHIPFLERIRPDRWLDARDGEVLTSRELLSRHSDMLPASINKKLAVKEPKDVAELLDSVDCHLIETQRLILLSDDIEDFDGRYAPHRWRHSEVEPKVAVKVKADLLKRIINTALTEYASVSQALDRSFPHRIVERGTEGKDTRDELSAKLDELDKRRTRLINAGILDAQQEEPVKISDDALIDNNVAGVLEVYVEDTMIKLGRFDSLLEKIIIFQDLMSQRFTDKEIMVGHDFGFKVVSSSGRNIPLDKLSSGEQHQLVLFFDLLFEVKPNSLILIDEPELSLHVSWQKSFISSLKKIISNNEIDVILATHSPWLVSDHNQLMFELDPDDEG